MTTRMNTPNLVGLVSDQIEEEMALHEKHLGDDWENTLAEPCPKCNGTGKNPEFPEDPFCYGCEGTGTWYILYYGMKDGHMFAYADEYGVDFIKEYCKDSREAYQQQQLTGKIPDAIMPFVVPKVLEFELIGRGYHPEQFYSGKHMRQIANIIAREYPAFMCVPYTKF